MSDLDLSSLTHQACLACGQDDDTENSAFGERLLLYCSSCSFRCIHVVRVQLPVNQEVLKTLSERCADDIEARAGMRRETHTNSHN